MRALDSSNASLLDIRDKQNKDREEKNEGEEK